MTNNNNLLITRFLTLQIHNNKYGYYMWPTPAVRIRCDGVCNKAQESTQDPNCRSEARVFTDYDFS